MKHAITGVALLTLTLSLSGCAHSGVFVDRSCNDWQQRAPSAELLYRVFLVGGAGAAAEGSSVMALLSRQITAAGENSAVVFLGDNIQCCGLPDSSDAAWPPAEAQIRVQLDAVKDYPGRVFFIPGDRDWNAGSREGLAAVARQERYIESHLGRGNVFIPDDGFPGPVEVALTERLTLVALDTQWWLQTGEKAFGDTGEYDLDEAGDFLTELDDILYRNRKKNILVAGHHPLMSIGRHGGYLPAKAHLTPVPVIGSMYSLYRRFVGKRQDLVHVRYASLRHELEKLFSTRALVYASGHERNLQYFPAGEVRTPRHYVVSGSGSMATPVARGRGSAFTASKPGFVTVGYYADNSVWMEAWTPAGDASGRLLFRTSLKAGTRSTSDQPAGAAEKGGSYASYANRTMVTPINTEYARRGALGRFLLGSHRRDLWAIPVAFPVLDVGTEKGGLTPVKAGMSGQSTSIRFRGADDHQYVLRSIDKTAGRVWPPELRNTVARDLTQDQMSMIHPYAALVIPPLAEAAGVYHTNPKLFYVPDDARLGDFRDLLAGQVALLEERPDEDMTHLSSMGYAGNVIGYRKMYEKLDGDNDHRVDARAVARARLFDLLIGDWDRHFDQWRWAAFEPADGKGKVYRPIPRDRDMALLRLDGIFPTIYRLILDPKNQDFRNRYGYLKGLAKKGLSQDRRLTATLTRADWRSIADSIQAALGDTVIEQAMRAWPAPIRDANGSETAAILKVRRDKLSGVANTYYGILAEVVDVVGSNKHERFEVTRRSDDETEVVVYKTSKQGEIRKEIYRRVFRRGETKEIRLYGLAGSDRFIVKGDVRKSILVRAIGGNGEDEFNDTSLVRGPRRRTVFYDTNGENTWRTGPETRVVRSADPAVNEYDIGAYKYGLVRPVGYFGYNKDEGLFVGGGVKVTQHGFRKVPHARIDKLRANFSAATQAFNIRYTGQLTSVLGPWDFGLDAQVRSPNSIRNFYGLGNETTDLGGDAEFYQARLAQVVVKPRFERSLSQGLTLRIGPTLEYTDVRSNEGRFLATQEGIAANTFKDQLFGGVEAAFAVETVDHPAYPVEGVRWTGTADLNVGLRNSDEHFARLATDLSFFISPAGPVPITFALRAGAAHNIGDFPFYAANTLGGASNLRGYRGTRFAGRTSFYHNAELRLKLLDFSGYFGYGDAGILGFYDTGRVWTEEDDGSSVWHEGYGGGLWIAFFRQLVLTGSYGLSEEDSAVAIGFGFQF